MQRITLTLDDELVAELDRRIEAGAYTSRSEAFRDIARAGLQHLDENADMTGKACVAAMVYVYDRDTRELAKRLAEARARHHDLTIASTSIDLDHSSCLEVAMLRGPTAEVKHLGDRIAAERGVRYGRLVVVPVEVSRESHQHGGGRPHAHDHFRVRESG